MRLFLRYFLLPVAAVVMMSAPCSAWEFDDDLDALTASPNCSSTPPIGINSSFYLLPRLNKDEGKNNQSSAGDKKMFYCHGDTVETQLVYNIFPSWKYTGKENLYYPIEFINTAGGVLAVHPTEIFPQSIFLNGKPIISDLLSARIEQAVPEVNGNPAIVIVNLEPYGSSEFSGRHLIDLGVVPPFISPREMFIGIANEASLGTFRKHPAPAEARIDIKHTDTETYEVSGQYFNVKTQKWSDVTYSYNRRTRTVKKS